MADVHVVYTGIVSFVPLQSPSDPEPRAVRVLIPDARKHRDHRHVPFLLVNKDDIEGQVPRELKVVPLPHGGDCIAFELNGYDIELSPTPSEPFKLDTTHIVALSAGCPPNQPNCGRVNSKYASGHHPDELAARAVLDWGSLAPSHVPDLRFWEFEGGATVGHLAQEVCHNFTITGDRLTIVFKRGSQQIATLPVNAREDGRIEVFVGNTLPEDIQPDPSKPPKEPRIDRHVALFYGLSSAGGGSQVLKWESDVPFSGYKTLHDHDRGCGPGIRAVGGANCPPGVWDPEP